jgi:phospholipid-binding lipoprotein MlaA
MNNRLHLLVVFFITCLIIYPGLLFAESSDQAPAQDATADLQTADESKSQVYQPDVQSVEEMLRSPETTDKTGDSSEYSEPDEFSDYSESEESPPVISDPLEPINRAFFVFNDKVYFWFLRPVAKGYKAVAPEPVRVGVRNFFFNFNFPIRFINCLLQGKFSGAGYEFERFFINSTLGLAGFIDMAGKEFGVQPVDEDFGQTLAFYGLGQGFYINLPILGPSSALDSVGLAGDFVADPVFHTDMPFKYEISLKAYKTINNTSLAIGDYETLRNAALDPYVAFRDAYIQYRQRKIKE